jgi:ribosomal protein L35
MVRREPELRHSLSHKCSNWKRPAHKGDWVEEDDPDDVEQGMTESDLK